MWLGLGQLGSQPKRATCPGHMVYRTPWPKEVTSVSTPPRIPLSIDFVLTSVLMAIMVIITFIQVIYRYLLTTPLSWPEEIARWLLIWITFAGAAFGQKHGSFVSIDYFAKRFFPGRLRLIDLFDRIIVIAFFTLFALSGYLYLQQTIASGQLAPVTRLPAAIPKSAIFVGSCLVLVVFISKNLADLSKSK